MSTPSTRFVSLILAASLALASGVAAAQGDDGGLSGILQGLEWGVTQDEVLAHYRAQYLQDYQTEIAGIRDAIEIDRVRRAHDQRYQRVVNSYEVFDQMRTGYEVSVLGGEVAADNAESMLTVRTDNAILYYAFYNDQLFKVVVAYNSAYLGGLDFESFIDQVEARYGSPDASEMDETATGSRYLARATWHDGDTRLRVENRSNLFGTFVMVFTAPTIEDRALASRSTSGEFRQGVQVSEQVRALQQERGHGDRSNVADEIIGSPTVVELVVPEAAPVDIATPAEARPMADPTATAEAEAEAQREAEEEEARAQRRREREREQREEEEEEGITIY